MLTIPTAVLDIAQATASSGDALTGFAGWAVKVMETLGGLGIALLVALENLFPPIPSEIILPLAGFTASQGQSFSVVGAIIWATAGSLIGALALYGIARIFGRERTRKYMAMLPLFDISDVDKTEAFFDKHNRSTVFFGRMIPIFRSLISLPAGVIKMNLWVFIAFTTVGSAMWNTALVIGGYVLGENWHIVENNVGVFSKVVAVVIVVAIVVWVALRIRRNKNRASS
ncbi:MAG: DedA family protein [Actinomycetaceae bacterium]|nr:DedA family protein [Arcanobacterium sp.]MDD7505665.1 DedA family protein [Actinomycetaceae bacterium]MDY6143450.1 DedA family protein [Arcanobacterium sp.]